MPSHSLLGLSLFKTRFGLRLRSVGEHPKQRDTLGNQCLQDEIFWVSIFRFSRWNYGAIYAQSISVNFSVTTIVGPDLSLCCNDLGKWNPIGYCYLVSSLTFTKFSCYWFSIAIPTRSACGLSSNCTLCFDHSCLGSLLWKSSRN